MFAKNDCNLYFNYFKERACLLLFVVVALFTPSRGRWRGPYIKKLRVVNTIEYSLK